MGGKSSELNKERLIDRYSTGVLSKDIPTELARLHALEKWSDPATIAMIRAIGIQAGWHCLEMGAGAGSMAYWLAEQCPEGDVIAADIDPRFLEAEGIPNLRIAQVDLVGHEYEKSQFDFIHSRYLLSHLPSRDDILQRAIGWLKPGGSILIEDFYVLPIDEIASDAARAVVGALLQVFRYHGADTQWARHIPNQLTNLGFVDIRVTMNPVTAGLDSPGNDVWRLGLDQFFPFMVEKGLVTHEQVVTYRAQTTGGMVSIPWFGISVSGRLGG